MEYAIAVIDIGMTNKKAAVYDDSLRQLDARYRNFEPVMIKTEAPPPWEVSGPAASAELPCHDLAGMEAWFIEQLRDFASHYPVKALAVSTHGATFVCTGKDGKPSLPCVYYTYEPGEALHRRFYDEFGKPEDLQARTGTPALKAMINPAKGLFFARTVFPEAWKRAAAVLPYPQYWGLRFTGKAGIEATYMGNHTYLWDQVEDRLSSVAEGLGIAGFIPGGGAAGPVLGKSWDVLGTIGPDVAEQTGLAKDAIVTLGIHDSNSALLPHFAKKGVAGFVLNSTGTWCVIMNPMDRYGFKPEELGKVVFFNISAFGKPVKTAIFLGGLEFETWSTCFQARHEKKDSPPWDEGLYRSILKEQNCFLLPELTPGSGQFPSSTARIVEGGRVWTFTDIKAAVQGRAGFSVLPPSFANYEKLFALLRISLVMQTLTALERTGIGKDHEIYTEGGFRKDSSYNLLLSSALKDNRVFLTDIAEATALGAAMTAKMALTGKDLAELAGDADIEYQELRKEAFPELKGYRAAWTALAEGRPRQA
ncbi:MAG: carbohydrate kinase [Treponema sp.]|jgi:sugar (pentulose or hexulose) kinase|nr:carbohydrate kinase [Treponema sp.]